MEYTVNGITIAYHPDNEVAWGSEHVLLRNAIDLSAGKLWSDTGFTIEALFAEPYATSFRNNVKKILVDCWKKAGVNVPDGFSLDQYHTVVADSKQHLAAVEYTKLLDTKQFPVNIELLEQRISAICGVPLKVFNPFDGQSVFHFRVIRPNSKDNNPLHRDIWLEDYDDCINLYIPIAGSSERSSLIIIPESHHWKESRIQKTVGGASINGIRFNVPAVTAIEGPFNVIRPDPREGEVLVFSPYLIHGGAVNLQDDKTRISLEIRLWRVQE